MSFINVVNRAGFGCSSDLLEQPQLHYGQAALSINANPVDGNLFIKDVLVPVNFPGFKLQVGMVYNSQSSDLSPWRLNQGKRISEIKHDESTGISYVTVTNSDGEVIRYNYDLSHGKYISQHPEITAELQLQSDNTWTGIDLATGITESYDSQKRITSQTTSDGHSIDYLYGNKDYPVGIKSGAMSVYLEESILSRKTDLIIKENNQEKTALTYHLDLRNRINQTVVPMEDGVDYSIEYKYTDPLSNCLESIKQSDNSSLNFDYEGNKVKKISDGEKRCYSLDYKKNETKLTLPAGGSQTVSFNQQQQIQSVIDHQLLEKHFEYDANNRVKKITYPDGSSHQFTRDWRGLVTVEIDRQEHKTTYKYDNHNGKLLNQTEYVDTVRRIEEHNTFYIYNQKGQLSYQVAANGAVTAYRYDSLGNIFEKCQYLDNGFDISQLNHESELSFVALSDWENTQAFIRANIHHEDQLPRVALTELKYDQYGQISKETTFDKVNNTGHGIFNEKASVVKYERDISGNLLKKKIRLAGNQDENLAEYAEEESQYDGLQRLLKHINPLGQVTESKYTQGKIETHHLATGLVDSDIYDAGGLLENNQQENENATRELNLTRDKAGHPAIITHPGGQKEYVVYNNKGKKRYHIDAEGYVSEFLYDKNNRLSIKISYEEKLANIDEAAVLNMSLHPAVSKVLTTSRFSYYPDGKAKIQNRSR